MSDQGILATTPTAPAAPPPATPAEFSDVGSVGESEGDLIKQALAELDGEQPAAELEKKPEAAPDKKPETTEEQTQKKLSAGYAKLAAREERHDRRVAEDTAKAQERDTAMVARESKVKPLEEALARAATSPLEALQIIGYTYKELVDYVMRDGQIPPEKFAERLNNESKAKYEELQAKVVAMEEASRSAQQNWEAQQEMAKNEHSVRGLFADGSAGLEKYPIFAHHFRNSPDSAQRLMVDVNSALAQHFNQTCVRDDKGRIVRPGEKLDAERAVMHIEKILRGMQVSQGNPGQPGAASQTANAGAERQQAPKPLTPRDSSVTSTPTDDELSKMSQEELDALSLRIYSGG